MRERKLSREEALEEYLVYQIRLYAYLHTFQVALQIKDDEYKPTNSLGHGKVEFLGTIRDSCYGLFASLMDPQSHALDVFDVWRVLFPDKEARITGVWKRIEPHIQLIRDYRNDVSFHVNKDLRRYFETRRRFIENRDEIIPAVQDFWDLAAELINGQAAALPNLREEMTPILKRALPGLSEDEFQRIKNYFIQ